MNQILVKPVKLLIVVALAITILGGMPVFASSPVPAPLCRIEGIIKSVEFKDAYDAACLKELGGCPTDMELHHPARYFLGINISSVEYISGPTDYNTCQNLYPIGSEQTIFIGKDKVRVGDVFSTNQKINGVVRSFEGASFDSYSITGSQGNEETQLPIPSTDKKENASDINGAEHRSTVSTLVQSLLNVANKEQTGIGEQVKAVAQEQNDTKDTVAIAIDKIQNRSKIKTFFIGTDYKNIGQLRSEMVKTGNQITQLARLVDQTASTSTRTTLQLQIQVLEQEQQKINDFLKANESKFSLFGWFVKLFSK